MTQTLDNWNIFFLKQLISQQHRVLITSNTSSDTLSLFCDMIVKADCLFNSVLVFWYSAIQTSRVSLDDVI